MFLNGGLDDESRCEVGIVTLPDGRVLNGQVAQGLYEITLREEFAGLNELTGSLTLTSGVQAAAGDKSLVDSLEGTVVWEYDAMACPQTIVKLFRGMMKAYVYQTNTYEGSTVVVEHQDKDQAAGLELAKSFLVRASGLQDSHQEHRRLHPQGRADAGGPGSLYGQGGEGDLTRLESGMSFMQVRASMSMKEKLRQVRGAICVNRRQIAHTRLEAIAGAGNPYSLITVFGRGHLTIKAGGAVLVTRCSLVEVVPRSHGNCTEEIPLTVNRTDAFVDPISYVIKSAGSPIHCNDVAPPRYKVGCKWYCSYPELKECHDPEMLPVDEVRIDPVQVNDIDLGKSIYTQEQLDEFTRSRTARGPGRRTWRRQPRWPTSAATREESGDWPSAQLPRDL